jgi:uncharacterized protein Yka (UPF0111/DUF47 family)
VNRSHWFLPHDDNLLGMLHTQAAITLEGFDALVAWSRGDADAEQRVREAEHRADDAKRELWRTLRDAFSPPMDAEDLFTLSAELDEVLNGAKDLVREMEVMRMEPDPSMADLCGELRSSVQELVHAFEAFGDRHADPTTFADAAIHHQRRVEHLYRSATSALLELDSVQEELGRREAYRRLARIGDLVHRVADRVWYATVKES